MIKSMTGYGRADLNNDEMTVTVEMRSLNHRYLDINLRLVKDYNFLEEKIISYIKEFVQRGKVDVYVSLELFSDSKSVIELNHDMVKEYLKVFNDLSKAYNIKNDIAVSDLAFNKDIFSVSKAKCNEKHVLSNVLEVLDAAIKKLIIMRESEGEKLYHDIEARIQNILLNIKKIEEISPNTVSAYRKRLNENLSKVLADIDIDEARILTESAIFAEKICVSEETVRLKSHIEQFRKAMNEGGPCGRKLDFITQEMNREANTIGSKAMDCSMAYIVVEIKSQLEKIREQVQNIE